MLRKKYAFNIPHYGIWVNKEIDRRESMCQTCLFIDLCGSQKCGDYVGDPWKVDENTELLEEQHARD